MRGKRICVFCSALSGLDPSFYAEAERFAAGLAARGWELHYGAGRDGLMGHFADEALKRGVPVRGAIPTHFPNEVAHPNLTETVWVKDLFERKRWMLEQSDAFAIFPGGYGTLDEALEVLTWKALGQLDRPIAFVDIKGFWKSQLQAFEGFVRAGAVAKMKLGVYDVVPSAEALLEALDGRWSGML